ncbi:hypothetical protein EON79_18035 [bacterium]|nr:MAG: hypothetical protein EON79_18035 [bacterium]
MRTIPTDPTLPPPFDVSRAGTMFKDFDDSPVFEASAEAAAIEISGEEDAPVAVPSSDFFIELDAWTEYWDCYDRVPDDRYIQLFGVVGPTVFAPWRALATATPAEREQREAALRAGLANPAVGQALLAYDDLLKKLIEDHFPGTEGALLDAEGYLNVIEAFARDILAPDSDRLARLKALDPENFSADGRKAHALRHTMDGPTMWFNWAAVVDCTALLEGEGGLLPHRALMLSGCAFGSSMDYTFRSAPGNPRGKTRPEYGKDEATEALLRSRAREWAVDGEAARAEARELFRISVS